MNQVKFTVEEAIQELQKYKDKQDIIYCDIWHKADLVADDESIYPVDSITDEKAVEMFSLIQRSHDANIGINWEVINCARENCL